VVAISLVVAFHTGVLPGGFVGVDVFFVVSGYLMTRQLLSRAASGRVRFADFYVRRALRLLPAAFVVIAATTLAGSWLLPATGRGGLTDDARASTLFGENWLLAARSTDYLADGLAASPFQHFWSLAVEEQFYVLWPALIGICLLAGHRGTVGRRGARAFRVRRWQDPAFAPRVGIALVLVASFVVCLAWSRTGSPAAYEATPTRVWELAAGGLLAAGPRRLGKHAARLAVWAGLGLVLAAALTLDGSGSYPDARALVPVIGACLVVAGARTGSTGMPARIAMRQPARWVGDASYSLYLWHWPVLVLLARAGGIGSGPGPRALAVAIALVLAAASTRWVERPVLANARLRGHPRRVGVAAGIAVALVLAITAVPGLVTDHELAGQRRAAASLLAADPGSFGAASITTDGWRTFAHGTAIVPVPADARSDVPPRATTCKSSAGSPTTPRCVFGDPTSTTTIALVGDSHMEQYVPAFEVLARREGWRVLTFLHSSCPFTAAQRVSDLTRKNACHRANMATLATIQADTSIDVVVTSGRSAVPWVRDDAVPDPVQGLVSFWRALVSRAPVVAIRDNPLTLAADGTQACVAQHLADPDACDRPLTAALPYDPQPDAAALVPGVRLLDLTDAFCARGTCPPVVGNVLVNRDEEHLTATYARTLAARIASVVEAALRPTS
jgi:peptidoglycan/LPS O-acetylase OafA/YrhL